MAGHPQVPRSGGSALATIDEPEGHYL